MGSVGSKQQLLKYVYMVLFDRYSFFNPIHVFLAIFMQRMLLCSQYLCFAYIHHVGAIVVYVLSSDLCFTSGFVMASIAFQKFLQEFNF